MHQKLISVIIPTYNRASSVIEAVESVLAQSYPAIQIIVVDDGSQDDTAERVAQYKNVEYYYQENKGQAAARNLGLSYASGEYVASLDSDDIWHKDFVKAAVAAIERYEADFVFLNWTEISENNKTTKNLERSEIWQEYSNNRDGDWSLLNCNEVRRFFIQGFPAPSSALLIRRSSFVSGWNEEMKIADDWYLILEMIIRKPCRAAYTLSPYWTKRLHGSNIYDGREEEYEVIRDLRLHDVTMIMRRFQEQLSFAEKAFFRKILAENYINFARLNQKRDGFSLEVLRSIADGFKVAPARSFFYTLQMFFSFLKARFRIYQDKFKQFKAEVI